MSTLTNEAMNNMLNYSSVHIFVRGKLIMISSEEMKDTKGIEVMEKYKFSGILLYSGEGHNRLLLPDEESKVYSMNYKRLSISELKISNDDRYPYRLIFRIKSYMHRTKIMLRYYNKMSNLRSRLEIHHIDCDRDNFKLSNLWAMPKHIHCEVHSLMRNKGINAMLDDKDVELIVRRGLNYIYKVMDLSKYREKSVFYDEPFDEDRERDIIAYMFVKTAPYSNNDLMKYLSLSAINAK